MVLLTHITVWFDLLKIESIKGLDEVNRLQKDILPVVKIDNQINYMI